MIALPLTTLAVADFVIVMLGGAVTVVFALPQLVVKQVDPGVGGELPPVESTDA